MNVFVHPVVVVKIELWCCSIRPNVVILAYIILSLRCIDGELSSIDHRCIYYRCVRWGVLLRESSRGRLEKVF